MGEPQKSEPFKRLSAKERRNQANRDVKIYFETGEMLIKIPAYFFAATCYDQKNTYRRMFNFEEQNRNAIMEVEGMLKVLVKEYEADAEIARGILARKGHEGITKRVCESTIYDARMISKAQKCFLDVKEQYEKLKSK